jgi:hypothetical protein
MAERTGASPPQGRREGVEKINSAPSPNSSFSGGSSLANASFSGNNASFDSRNSSKRTKEEVKRDKEEEKNRKRDLKKEKERAKISVSLGLPEGEKILHGDVLRCIAR